MEEERDCIEEFKKIVRDVIAPIFKRNGFTKGGLNFYRNTNDIVQVLTIQKDRVSGGDYISFSLKLGLINEDIFNEYYHFLFPEVPTEVIGTLRLSVNSISSKYRNYKIIMDTDLAQLTSDIQFDLNQYVIPFFGKYNSTGTWGDLLDSKIKGLMIFPPVTRFLVYLKIGRREDAVRDLNDVYHSALNGQTKSMEYYKARRNSKQKKEVIKMHEEHIEKIKQYALKFNITLAPKLPASS